MNEFLELEERIVAMLKTVFDPEIPVNIYDLGLIYDWGGIRSKIDSSVYYGSPLASSLKTIEKVFNKAAKKTMGQD